MSDLMSFGDYQQWNMTTGFYPGKRVNGFVGNMTGLSYTALGLAGESGEVADKVKKILRDHNGEMTPDLREGLLKELGDVLWYLTALSTELNYSLEHVAKANIEKIEGRNARGTRSGEGDDR